MIFVSSSQPGGVSPLSKSVKLEFVSGELNNDLDAVAADSGPEVLTQELFSHQQWLEGLEINVDGDDVAVGGVTEAMQRIAYGKAVLQRDSSTLKSEDPNC